ncbi:MAG: PHP domain-containing protein [Spirochaetia bacterium]|jgi:hypothetical protein|nr:PHP domain-containing protein [Spirochaetia bacterium]
MAYRYETHLHTNVASACAISAPEEYIQPYLDAGFAGIIVTDHFFNGNSSIDKTLPWKARVEAFCSSYEKTKEAGSKLGLDVFFGWEHCFGNDEYLVYGLDKAWLENHPQIMGFSHEQLFSEVQAAGGAMVQAHPFRTRDYISSIELYPYAVHGVEVANAGNMEENDRRAFRYAQTYHLPMTAGTDIHDVRGKSNFYGVVSDRRWKSIKDYVQALRQGKQLGLLTDRMDLEGPVDSILSLPVNLHA